MKLSNFFFLLIVVVWSSFLQGASQKLMPWASQVEWSSLEKYADTITAPELEKQLNEIYVPDGSWKTWITITPHGACIEPFPGASERIELPLASSKETCKPIPRYWRVKVPDPILGKPLKGLHIVLDPGHLGGSWGKMEERWFCIAHSKPVEEGTMAFITAKILAKKLRNLGAIVDFTRNHLGPTTPLRPYQLRKAAIADFHAEGRTSWTPQKLKQREKILFYRTAEIHHRAELVNNRFHPDLVICLHYDAEEWDDPKHPKLVDNQRVHFLIGGDFNQNELKTEEDRFMMLRKLLGQTHREEVEVAEAVAHSFVMTTGLPPFVYHNPLKARAASPSSLYVWDRNLLATRLFQAPVLYCEAYVMNDRYVFKRIQLGDYNGTKNIDGEAVRSIYRDYADAVAHGVAEYFGSNSFQF